MRPKDTRGFQGEMFERELETLVRPNHGLVKLSRQIQWERFDEKFGVCYSVGNGRPGIPTRLMVGLTYLKYLHNISDEAVLELWVENPYWQYFCGERYFQHQPPCDRTTLTRWRNRIGEAGAEELFAESLAVAKGVGMLKMSYLKELYVDTTVQEKNIAYPSEANLLNRARRNLVQLAKNSGIELRQSYARTGKWLQVMAHRYAAAQQWNRARKATRKLRTFLGRIVREVERKATEAQKPLFSELITRSKQLIESSKGGPKLYSLHEPSVEAIAKGKMHKRFEFGVKVSVVTTRKRGFVLGCKAIHGNPYDGHTLKEALTDVEQRLGRELKSRVGVDLGYRGHDVKERFRVFHPKLKKLNRATRLFVRARSKVEASISFLKRCCRLGKNYLKGKLGDLMNALFAGAASNLSNVLRATG